MRRRNLADDERAAVYVEFLVVFMPIFMLFLGMIQVGFLYTGKLVVSHAADSAARSAIVILPDDPEEYGGSPKHSINFNEVSSSGGVVGQVTSVLGMFGIDVPENLLSRGDRRLNMVRLAAFRPLMAIAPPPQAVFDVDNPFALAGFFDGDEETARDVLSVIGMENGDRIAQRFFAGLLYTAQAASVTFPSGPRAGGAPTSGSQTFPAHSRDAPTPLTTRVTYAFVCLVPGAAKLMCDPWGSLGESIPEGGGAEARSELNGSVARGAALLNGNGLYYVLRAEATMSYQGALYTYRSES